MTMRSGWYCSTTCLQSGAEITHQRAADAAGVQLIDLDAGLLQEAAVNADLTELVLDQHHLLTLKSVLQKLFDQSCFRHQGDQEIISILTILYTLLLT